MKKLLSSIIIFALLLSCTVTGVTATSQQEPEPPFYFHYPVTIMVAGLPKTIRAQFDYDRNFIDIVPDYPDRGFLPSYNGVGFAFPLATERYGGLYDVSYTVNDTIISYTYTLKSGVTIDDYLDALDAINTSIGAEPESRKDSARHAFEIFDIAMKIEEPVFAKIVDNKILEVITADGRSLDVNSNLQSSEVSCYYTERYLPNPDDPELPTEEIKIFKYRDKLLSQYQISGYSLFGYDELYEHKDENGEVDWVLVTGMEERTTPSEESYPAYYEFGNRVMDVEDAGEPFSFGMGVYSVKHDRFFDVSSPELYELDGIERVWTELGAGRLMGDMDGDNTLTIADATLIQRCAARMAEYPSNDKNEPIGQTTNPIGYFSDFDQDGDRTLLDATAIQLYLSKLKYRSEGWKPYPHRDQPKPTQSEPTHPEPTQPEPTQPEPTHPEPTQPEPTQPEPTQPEPTQPEPTQDATEPLPKIPDTPQITDFKSTADGVEIHIGTVRGAEKYRVYYKNKNGNWVKMGETDNGVFVDTDVKTGTSYLYTVRCIKADLSEFTSDFNKDGWRYTYYPQPKITRCEAVADGVKITWDSVKGAEKYRIYYKGSKGWTKMADVSSTSYVDTDVSGGHNYTYTVRCVSSDGQSFKSDYDSNGTKFYLANNPGIEGFTTRMDGVDVHLFASRFFVRLYRKTAGGSWTRIAQFDSQDSGTYRDTDVEPGKTYYYTARYVDENGVFLSYYNTSGWNHTYRRSDCVPELEFFMYNGEDTVLVQPKDDNKFGIKNFNLHVIKNSEYVGTFEITDEPCYIRADFFTSDNSYLMYLVGVDASGNEITKTNSLSVWTMIAPTDLKAERTGDRRYRFTWQIYYGYPDWYNVSLISADGEYVIESGDLTAREYDVDLSDYPEDTEWIAVVWVTKSDKVSVSWVERMDFSESDYS